MQRVVADAYQQFGRIDGVIHAAGLTDRSSFDSIHNLTREMSEPHFRAKMRGLVALAEALEGREPDFCLLVSSLSSVLGGLRLAAYSAANNFMDAFAHRQANATKVQWISVNWDGWRFEDEPEPNQPSTRPENALLITPPEGAQVLDFILSHARVPQVVVSTTDLRVRLHEWVNPAAAEGLGLAKQSEWTGLHDRPALKDEYVPARNDIDSAIINIWQRVLGIDRVGIRDNFFALGGHSLLATQVALRLRDTFKMELPLETMFDASTVAELTDFLTANERIPGQSLKVAGILIRIENTPVDDLRRALDEKRLALG